MNYIIIGLSVIGIVSCTSFDCFAPPPVSQDKRPNTDIWKVAQYNVEWLFTEPYNDCPGNGCEWDSSTEEWEHLKTVANVIQSLNADTIHLCEVQSCTQLEQLNTFLSQPYTPYLIEGTDTSTGQNVGLLSLVDPIENITRTDATFPYPIENSTCANTTTDSNGEKGVSKNLFSHFSINNMNIVLIGAHLLAEPLDYTRCLEREAQSQVLQEQIYHYITLGYEIIMMGDFNDFDKEIPDLNNNTPISLVLDTLKGYNGIYANMYQLYSIGDFVSQTQRFTEWWDANGNCEDDSNEFSAIDHILVSKKLQQYISNVEYIHSYNESCNTLESDHYPIMVTFNFTL